MNFPLAIITLVTINISAYAQERDSISRRLRMVMENRTYYDARKSEQIVALKQLLVANRQTPRQQYAIHLRLSEAYKKYKADSAVFYTQQSIAIATALNDQQLNNQAAVQLAWLYSTEGLYIESKELLDHIDRASLAKQLLPDYYEAYLGFCSHYGQSNNNVVYYRKSELYRDSLLSVLDPLSLKYRITDATRMLYQSQTKQAEESLLLLLDQTSDKDPERALIAYLLGVIYKNKNDVEQQQKFFAISAIADVVNAIKDNASMQSLALTYYDMDNVDLAYQFIQAAINDAIFCNVRYRTVESSSFYPIINASFQEKERQQKRALRSYLLLISVLSLVLIAGIMYIYQQMKRLGKTRKALYQTNQQLSKLNTDLQQANDQLFESNHIKEEYIAHFFDICSAYIEKLESYRKSLHKKAMSNQLESLMKDLKSTDLVEKELEKLYESFDSIFLNLYPTFVKEFNSLLLQDEQILPKHHELLSTELRIFALVRLGITDSIKIASFLRYSLRTVYNYRTKVRNKARVSRDEFEEQVKAIGTFRKP
ncbi:DUF6377 domain-containing protein [Olivibacter ginsenosidimutans]